MIDKTTGKRIEVKTDGNAGPYIIMPESQASKVRDLLKTKGVCFTENPNSIRGENGNDTIFDFGNGADVDKIQSILDNA